MSYVAALHLYQIKLGTKLIRSLRTPQPSQLRFTPLVFIFHVVNCGKGDACPGAMRRKFLFPRYGAAHGHAQEPTPRSAVEFRRESVPPRPL